MEAEGRHVPAQVSGTVASGVLLSAASCWQLLPANGVVSTLLSFHCSSDDFLAATLSEMASGKGEPAAASSYGSMAAQMPCSSSASGLFPTLNARLGLLAGVDSAAASACWESMVSDGGPSRCAGTRIAVRPVGVLFLFADGPTMHFAPIFLLNWGWGCDCGLSVGVETTDLVRIPLLGTKSSGFARARPLFAAKKQQLGDMKAERIPASTKF